MPAAAALAALIVSLGAVVCAAPAPHAGAAPADAGVEAPDVSIVVDGRALTFGRWLGSDYTYAKIKADLRTYIPVGASHALALQAYVQSAWGNVPFMALPMFGSDNTMRGYYAGRFRDKSLCVLQAEYRLPFFWKFGLVGFAGVGRVAPSLGRLALSGLKPSAGWGLRFKVTPEGANLRLDFGYGMNGSSGMYLTAGEAF